MVKLAKSFFLQAAKLPYFFLSPNAKLNVEHNYKASMTIFKHTKDLKDYLEKQALIAKPIGFVPTMGTLHAGHLSLINQCRKVTKLTVCSIFVNPTQFNNPEDFKKYPKTIENDILLLEENGCDVLFMPVENEIYPDKKSKEKYYDLGYLETVLEGKFRPGHFQGVCLVVEKLINIVDPDFIFIGQKDFQQCLVIKKLLDLMHKKIQVIICPILREKTGLAMSSRNLRLDTEDRKLAAKLQQALVSIKDKLSKNNFLDLKNKAIADLENEGFKVEYLELAKRNNLELVTKFEKEDELVMLIAGFLKDVRLIDNILIKG